MQYAATEQNPLTKQSCINAAYACISAISKLPVEAQHEAYKQDADPTNIERTKLLFLARGDQNSALHPQKTNQDVFNIVAKTFFDISDINTQAAALSWSSKVNAQQNMEPNHSR